MFRQRLYLRLTEMTWLKNTINTCNIKKKKMSGKLESVFLPELPQLQVLDRKMKLFAVSVRVKLHNFKRDKQDGVSKEQQRYQCKDGRRFVLGSERIDVFTLEMPVSILTAMFFYQPFGFTS